MLHLVKYYSTIESKAKCKWIAKNRADVKGVAREKSYFTGKEKEGALLSAKVELEPEKKKKYK